MAPATGAILLYRRPVGPGTTRVQDPGATILRILHHPITPLIEVPQPFLCADTPQRLGIVTGQIRGHEPDLACGGAHRCQVIHEGQTLKGTHGHLAAGCDHPAEHDILGNVEQVVQRPFAITHAPIFIPFIHFVSNLNRICHQQHFAKHRHEGPRHIQQVHTQLFVALHARFAVFVIFDIGGHGEHLGVIPDLGKVLPAQVYERCVSDRCRTGVEFHPGCRCLRDPFV